MLNYGIIQIVIWNLIMLLLVSLLIIFRVKEKETPLTVVRILAVAFSAPLLTALLEVILRGSIKDTLTWIAERTIFFRIDSAVVMIILLLFYFLTDSAGVAYIISGVITLFLTLVEVNYYNIRGDAFRLSEFAVAGEAGSVISGYRISIPFLTLLFVVAAVILTAALGFKRDKLRFFIRIPAFIILLACLILINTHISDIILHYGGFATVTIAKSFYDKHGYAIGLMATEPRKMKKPEGYSETRVNEIKAKIKETSDEGNYPNIIFIQNESFYDTKYFGDFQASGDPIEGLYSLQEECIGGEFVSPTAGGGTCNAEYEAITGYPYANTGGTPYTELIRPGTKSVASILGDRGYETVAIHPNTGKFYNREKVYKNLGFERTVFLDDMNYTEEDMIHGWMDDRAAMRNLISDYENRDTSKPYFAFLVTVQNHGGYDFPYDEGGITAKDRQITTFLNMEKNSVRALEELTDYFREQENTIIVFWGDHCPSYHYFGVEMDDSRTEVWADLHKTPLLIWNNYGLPKDDLGDFAAYRVPGYVMGLAGIHSDPYMEYMNENPVPDITGMTGDIIIRDDGSFVERNEWTEEERTCLDDIKVMQYDRFFGKDYMDK